MFVILDIFCAMHLHWVQEKKTIFNEYTYGSSSPSREMAGNLIKVDIR